MKLLPSIVIGAVVVAVVASFFVIGSPMTERVRRFDDRRVSDLQSIQWEVVNYWQMKARLPENLDALRNDIRGFVPPIDSETGAAYEYRGYGSGGPVSFELCATFSMATDGITGTQGMTKPVPMGRESENWAHGVGRTCFKRTIDKDLYPPASQRGEPVPMKPLPMVQ